MNNNKLKLYTFQPMFVWESLNELGYFHPFFVDDLDEFLSEEKKEKWGFYHSYQWLKNQMYKKNISFSHSNSQMIWAWYQWGGNKKKAPDKRYKSVYEFYKNIPFVLLELEIEADRVLLSDFDTWHHVLNYWYLVKERESNKFSKKYNFYSEKPLSNPEANKVIEDSWQTIFDLKLSRKLYQNKLSNQQIQATFFELFYNDVTKVHFFENKKCTKVLNLK